MAGDIFTISQKTSHHHTDQKSNQGTCKEDKKCEEDDITSWISQLVSHFLLENKY